jgi:hypothetical protein
VVRVWQQDSLQAFAVADGRIAVAVGVAVVFEVDFKSPKKDLRFPARSVVAKDFGARKALSMLEDPLI